MKPTPLRLLSVASVVVVFGCGDPGEQPPSASAVESPGTAPGTLVAPAPEAYGQMIYVSAYSHIYHIRQSRDFQLTVTLSIRNPFPWRSITITRVDYFDSSGNFVRSYLNQARDLGPLETLEYVVAQDDKAGGSGANFLVGWVGSDTEAGPIAEAVMIGTDGGQGLSFVTVGRAIRPE